MRSNSKTKIATSNSRPNSKPDLKNEQHCHNMSAHPDHSGVLPRLMKVKGQLNGIEKMIVDRRYCVDILTQFRAAAAAMKSLEGAILGDHIRSCVKDAMNSKTKVETDKKISELMELFLKRI